MARNAPVQVTGTITAVKLVGTSRNGNPTYRVTIHLPGAPFSGSFLTQTDGQVGYAADNFRPDSRETKARENVLHINSRGRVVHITGPDRHEALFG